ncbi:transporter substrate-binding domain-containing protein [Undibacterium sp. TS12]|uniref:substrate-binding periplasmic protein n=1 Tax=Undibacterium sp. TS12 TaxID=2908202 RepID=UPI001F4CBB14|nr:transporter substrate-binding domain-containing protein [Undibacterium sp. TS12]MCH8622467.1 transporter substrate-binding domain-containing protein [Undibacterium sp. TS12]
MTKKISLSIEKTGVPFLKAGILICLLAGLPSAFSTDRKIVVAYNERPPYLISNADGSVSGLTATPVARAFKNAHIDYVWEKEPTNRQLQNIRESLGPYCGVGWFKNPEREKFAKFTKPIYRDQASILVANTDFKAPGNNLLTDILNRRDIRILVKSQYSYGQYIDALISKMKPTLVQTTAENISMIRMIMANRADFMFISEEEAAYSIEQAGFAPNELQLIHVRDMPEGEKRYLMCNKNVPDEVIEKLNQFIVFE